MVPNRASFTLDLKGKNIFVIKYDENNANHTHSSIYILTYYWAKAMEKCIRKTLYCQFLSLFLCI